VGMAPDELIDYYNDGIRRLNRLPPRPVARPAETEEL
jgi:hypothetical protein